MKTTTIYEFSLGDLLKTYSVLSGATNGKIYIDEKEVDDEMLNKPIKIVVELNPEVELNNIEEQLTGSKFKITKKKEENKETSMAYS